MSAATFARKVHNQVPAHPLKTFGVMAAVAFVAGFLGYLMVAGVSFGDLQAGVRSQMAWGAHPSPAVENQASTPPAASDPWNIPKKI